MAPPYDPMQDLPCNYDWPKRKFLHGLAIPRSDNPLAIVVTEAGPGVGRVHGAQSLHDTECAKKIHVTCYQCHRSQRNVRQPRMPADHLNSVCWQ